MNWKLALDVQMEQHRWQMSEDGIHFTVAFFDDFIRKHGTDDRGRLVMHDPSTIREDSVILTKNLNTTLWRADTMYITTEMQHLLLQAAHDLPDEATFDVHGLLTPMGFCLLEETIYGEDVRGDTIAMSGFAWHTAPAQVSWSSDTLAQAICIYFFTPTDDISDEINRKVLPYMRERGMQIPPLALSHYYPALDGRPVPVSDERGSDLIIGLLKLFLAIQYIGHQPIGTPMKMRPDRAARKRFAREHPNEPERLISLITLRRKKVEKDDHEPAKVEWSRRWIVRGFWRKQWYPKSKTHDWKYIHEYIKGPEDKPLVITERRVFNFRR